MRDAALPRRHGAEAVREIRLPSGRVVRYRARRSQRSRNVRLRISPLDGLSVTLPTWFPGGRIDEVLHEKAAWIERHLARIAAMVPPALPVSAGARPERLELVAVGEDWRVVYRAQSRATVGLRVEGPGRLLAAGPVDEPSLCQAALKRWLAQRARSALQPWLDELSAHTGLRYARMSIRAQRVRWGSCSADGAISLNLKLMFLPPELVRYVLLHELCHTRELNHSARFWRLLESVEPRARSLHLGMQAAGCFVPRWVEGARGIPTVPV